MATPVTIAWIAAMRVQDFYRIGGQAWVRIVTDGVERIEPVDRVLEAYLDEYIAAAGIGHDPGSRLFRYFRGGKISPLRVTPRYISDLIKRHARSGLAQGRQR